MSGLGGAMGLNAWLELADGHVHRLSGHCRIGRFPDNDLVLLGQGISRHHACLDYDEKAGTYRLSDVGSTNGTYVNQVRLEGPKVLSDKDTVALGGHVMVYRSLRAAQEMDTIPAMKVQARHRLLFVGEDSLQHSGLKSLLMGWPEFEVLGQMTRLGQARRQVLQLKPDLVLCCANYDAGELLSLVKDLLLENEGLRLMVLFARVDGDLASRLLKTGVLGCVQLHDSPEEILRAIQGCLAGGTYLSRRLAGQTFKHLAGSEQAGRQGGPAGLTDRELQIFHLCGVGRQNKEIAQVLGMSVKTVETHKENIKLKLCVGSSAELQERARAWVEGGHDTR